MPRSCDDLKLAVPQINQVSILHIVRHFESGNIVIVALESLWQTSAKTIAYHSILYVVVLRARAVAAAVVVIEPENVLELPVVANVIVVCMGIKHRDRYARELTNYFPHISHAESRV